MNELIGPIYYVFASDSDLEWAEHAEANTFHCFEQLMSEMKDNFIKTLDKSNCGIEIAMKNFYDRLQAHDSQLYNRL
uniref:Rab-GAP TBC domain-containing protein n=1 Tax=Panagrolaimus sp. PS1159 TaxID=55785 RepID=A0AC35G6B6_9BILA